VGGVKRGTVESYARLHAYRPSPHSSPFTLYPLTPYVDFLTGSSPGSYDAFISYNQQPSIM
jgi:hypothetical protein